MSHKQEEVRYKAPTFDSSREIAAGVRARKTNSVLSATVFAPSVFDTWQIDSPDIATERVASDLASIPNIEIQAPMPLWYRAFEKLVAAIALLVFALPMLLISLIVRLGTPGPALFFQDRLGLGAKKFKFVKFRTMFVDARERFPDLYRYQYTDEQVQAHYFKVNEDPRLTPQGVWLRKTTLDEIPNFLAVLTGEMSLVGPRPEIPEMLRYYNGDTLKKFSVYPGITGLAQTCGRGHLNFRDTVAYDLEYVENRSVWLNIKILARTVKIVLNHHGAF
jgi:lipopolysaccharide/colanic/teichoic acid biosynthesis glycosyltransferase